MLPRLIRRLGGGVTGAMLSAVLALTACSGEHPAPTPGGGGSSSGNAGAFSYAVKTDLCADADLAPLKAVLPAVKDLKSQQLPASGGLTFFSCSGEASKTDAYDDIGFFSLQAFIFDAADRAAEQYENNTDTNRSSVKDAQPVPGLGQRAVSFIDGLLVSVYVLDGTLEFIATWSPNGSSIPAGVREALVETTRATLAKLKT
jgi:hypothetical protein